MPAGSRRSQWGRPPSHSPSSFFAIALCAFISTALRARQFGDSYSYPFATTRRQASAPARFRLLFSDPVHARMFGSLGEVTLQAWPERQKLGMASVSRAPRHRLRLSPNVRAILRVFAAGMIDFLVEFVEIELPAVGASHQPADEMAVIHIGVQPLECFAAQIVRRFQPEAAARGAGIAMVVGIPSTGTAAIPPNANPAAAQVIPARGRVAGRRMFMICSVRGSDLKTMMILDTYRVSRYIGNAE